MSTLKTLSPWMIFYKEIDALFKYDHEVQVIYDEDDETIKLLVDNANKADALSGILPTKKEFGNVSIYIEVIPSNKLLRRNSDNLMEIAFADNDAVVSVETTRDIPGFPSMTFVIFKKEVVQYFTDNLGDYHGLTSTLYQEIAKKVFINVPGVYFCTDTYDSNSGPWEF